MRTEPRHVPVEELRWSKREGWSAVVLVDGQRRRWSIAEDVAHAVMSREAQVKKGDTPTRHWLWPLAELGVG